MSAPGRFYITTPIYYVNDRPHIGHAYCTVLADALARYHRLFGDETWFVTGTDEHGQKVQEAAARRGVTPQEHCDELFQSFRDLWPELDVEVDDFIRTTEPRHVHVVEEALQRLFDRGEIYTREYEGWYSTAAERFWTEKDLVDGRCPDSGQPVEWITERNYFFRMSSYAARLKEHIETHPDFIRPPHRANEVLGFLAQGVEDLCISRPKERLAWGIPLPFDPDYVTYVWFDALLNYVTALGWPDDSENFERWWPHANHLIGKDILITHSVYWTTMLMALEVPLPRSITATGWWLQDDVKMSKSLGNVVSPLGMKDVYGADVLRYFLLRDMVIGQDASFSEEALVRRNNSDLANDLGNLARRAAGLATRWFEGKVPEPAPAGEEELNIADHAKELAQTLPDLVRDLKIHTAIEETMQFVRRLNRLMTTTEPFKTVKTDPAKAALTLYTVFEGLRHAAWLLWPIVPEKAEELLDSLGAAEDEPSTLDRLRWGGLRPGTSLSMDKGLFPRVERTEPEAPPEPEPAEEPEPDVVPPPASIGFSDFQKVELRVATVLVAEKVQGAEKLLRFELDLGEGKPRQVMSGIAPWFPEPASLVGTQVVVASNLAPKKIFKLESRGMVLTTETTGGGLALLRPGAPAAPGTRVA